MLSLICAMQAYEQVSTELDHEESLKQQLCDELNQLVSTSVSSQLERFEQLKVKLEALHGGAGAMARASSAPTQYAPSAAALGAGTQAGKGLHDAQGQQQKAAGGAVDAGSQQHDQQLQPPVEAQPPLPVLTSAVAPDDAQAAAAKAAAAAAAAEAQAARSRHVQLPGRTQHAAAAAAANGGQGLQHHGAGPQQAAQQHAGSRQPSQHSSQATRDREGRFAGFD